MVGQDINAWMVGGKNQFDWISNFLQEFSNLFKQFQKCFHHSCKQSQRLSTNLKKEGDGGGMVGPDMKTILFLSTKMFSNIIKNEIK